MSLDILIRPSEEELICEAAKAEPTAKLDDDAYLAFLDPFFEELAGQTGIQVDPYAWAFFKGPSLAVFRETLAKARVIATRQPASWPTIVGWRGSDFSEPISGNAERDHLLRLVDDLDAVAKRAQELDWCLVFFGD